MRLPWNLPVDVDSERCQEVFTVAEALERGAACNWRESLFVNGLETKEECNVLSARSISFKEKVDERLRAMLNCHPGKEMKESDKHSLIW